MLMLLNYLVQMLQTELQTWLRGYGSLQLTISQTSAAASASARATVTASATATASTVGCA